MRNVVETDIETLVQAARDALVRGDSDAAWQLSAQALEAGRDYVEVRQFLGFIARGRRDLDLADTHYAAALAMAPTDGLLHNNLAEVRHAQGHVAEALALYRRGMASVHSCCDGSAVQAMPPRPTMQNGVRVTSTSRTGSQKPIDTPMRGGLLQ